MATNATPAALRSRMEKVSNELAAERRALSRGATMTLFFGVVILALIGVYFYIGYGMIIARLQPKDLVDTVEDYVMRNVPEVRKAVEGEIKGGAPSWAELASVQTRELVPDLRAAAQSYMLNTVDDNLKEGAAHTRDIVSTCMTKNKAMIAEGIKKLAGSDKEAESFIKDVTDTVAKELELDLPGGIKRVFDIMDALAATIVQCKSDRGLTRTQEEVREVLRLVKRLFNEAAPVPEEPTPLGVKPSKPAAK